MINQSLRLVAPGAAPVAGLRPLGRYLVEAGVITGVQLVQALQMQARFGVSIGEILIAQGWANSDDIVAALSQQHGIPRADLVKHAPDPELAGLRPPSFWLQHKVMPWQRAGGSVLIATARPDQFAQVKEALGKDFSDPLPVLASESAIEAALATCFAEPLAVAAQSRVAPEFSCRTWQKRGPVSVVSAISAVLALLAIVLWAPMGSLAVFSGLALVTLTLFCGLKFAGFLAYLLKPIQLNATSVPLQVPQKWPKVSVLVPLFREREIASSLIDRLTKLSYPKALLDVVLVLEEHDALTRDTLDATNLPGWMRVITVPSHGGLTTKPRAMNYALDFCKGDILGVWDAEDAPTPDQIEQVVSRFASAPSDVVCLQGILDYYNPRSNWMARCFTIEYASWFRIVLPGIARLGLVVPLGGTTLFFRRSVLEELGGWDAHNVTEDADLGVRLCRAGYRTELIDTVTFEEANCRVWPWVRQRSRWLKGFMVTYLVHMRDPVRLYRDLGGWRFLGFQAFFLGTLGQFLLAPVLWSFWLVILGAGHPVSTMFGTGATVAAATVLGISEVLGLCVGLVAVSSARRRHLLPFVLTMMFYFPLGVLAAYKGLGELLVRPYFWDKTQHGHATEETPVQT